MTPVWDDLNARARGLGTRLLGRAELERLAAAPDLAAFAARLRGAGIGDGAAAPALELALRRRSAERLRTLAAWSRERTAALAIVFEDEDRRSLQAVLRGALQGAPPEARLAGVLPTPSLPGRALEELARQTSPGAVAALLVAWGNPYGGTLLDETRTRHPDLLRLETALSRTFAERALAAARGRDLVAFVRQRIDLENAATAIALAAHGADVPPEECRVAGGERLDPRGFARVAAAGDAPAAVRLLERAFAGSAFAGTFAAGTVPAGLEAPLLAAAIRDWTARARLDPIGPAPLLLYVLRLRAEALDLRRILWALAMGASPAARSLGMATP